MSVTINGDGTIGGVSAGGYGLTDADLPNGSVVQVVYAGGQPSSTLTTTSTSYVDTGISATITPSSSSNKVFVVVAASTATEETLVRFNVGKHVGNVAL